MRTLLIFLLSSVALLAQDLVNGDRKFTGNFDTSAAKKVTSPRLLASEPGTCDATTREQYYNTTTNKLRVCNTTNTWSDLSGSGSSDVRDTYYTVSGATTYLAGTNFIATKPVQSGWGWFTFSGGNSQNGASYSFTSEGALKLAVTNTDPGYPSMLAIDRGSTTQLDVFIESPIAAIFGSGGGSSGFAVGFGNSTSNSAEIILFTSDATDGVAYLRLYRYGYGTGANPRQFMKVNMDKLWVRIVLDTSGDSATFLYSRNGKDYVAWFSEPISNVMSGFDRWMVGVQATGVVQNTATISSFKAQ